MVRSKSLDFCRDEEEASDFLHLAASSAHKTPVEVRIYMWSVRETENLLCDGLIGPKILESLIESGRNVEKRVMSRVFYCRTTSQFSSPAAEAEAESLDRILHLWLLGHSTPQATLETIPEIEVLLRRRWCLLEVAMSCGRWKGN